MRMFTMKMKLCRGILCILIMGLWFLGSACQTPPCPTPTKEEVAILREKLSKKDDSMDSTDKVAALTRELLYQIKENCSDRLDEKVILINPFLVNATGRELKYQNVIDNVIARNMAQCFRVVRPASEVTPDFVLEGVIFHEKTKTNQNTPRMCMSVVDPAEGTILAATNALIQFDTTARDLDKKDPIPEPDDAQKVISDLVRKQPNEKVPEKYPVVLDARKQSSLADAFYNEGQYEKAIEHYESALEKVNQLGEKVITRVHDRMYQAYMALGEEEKAITYRKKRVQTAMEVNQRLDLELHFKINSTDFMDDEKYENETIIQSLAELFEKKEDCVVVFGHSSKTGSLLYNCRLSRKRARRIRNLIMSMSPDLKGRILARGRSYLESKMEGEATSDRRVEFSFIDCGSFRKVPACENLARDYREE